MKLQKAELIGTIVKFIDSKNKTNIGLVGKIIKETQSTFINQNHHKKRVIKRQNVFKKTKQGLMTHNFREDPKTE